MKKLMFVLVLSFILVISACAAEPANQQVEAPPADNGANVEAENGAGEADTNEEPEPTEPVAMKVGDTVAIGDWEVTLNSFEFVESLSEGMFTFGPDEGHMMAVSEITVKNNGTSLDTFLPVMSLGNKDVSVKLIYDNNFEFSFTNYLGLSGQIYTESLNPLSSKTGTIIFEVVDEVAQSDKPLHLTFNLNKEDYVFDVRQ